MTPTPRSFLILALVSVLAPSAFAFEKVPSQEDFEKVTDTLKKVHVYASSYTQVCVDEKGKTVLGSSTSYDGITHVVLFNESGDAVTTEAVPYVSGTLYQDFKTADGKVGRLSFEDSVKKAAPDGMSCSALSLESEDGTKQSIDCYAYTSVLE